MNQEASGPFSSMGRTNSELPKLSAAERQRLCRARRDADPERRAEYLRKEREKWRRDIQTGKKKLTGQKTKKEQRVQKEMWREAYKRRKTRTDALSLSNTTACVSDVERRSRSLRTQYGRVLWHPERVSTVQQKMLREKLDFLRPYIVRRRGDSYLEEKFDDREEDDEEPEPEGSFDQEMGSSFGSPLDAGMTGHDLNGERQCVTSTPNLDPPHCPNPQPQVTEVMSLSCPHHQHSDESSADQPDQRAAPSRSKHDILNQFAEVMLADMQQIKDPMVLMRLRRDITDLVFKAVEEDVQRRCTRVQGESTQNCSRPQQSRAQTDLSWRQRFLRRKDKGPELGRRMQRWEEIKHMRRVSRSQLLQPVQQGQALEGMTKTDSQVIFQASEIKRETEPNVVKIEEETLPLA